MSFEHQSTYPKIENNNDSLRGFPSPEEIFGNNIPSKDLSKYLSMYSQTLGSLSGLSDEGQKETILALGAIKDINITTDAKKMKSWGATLQYYG